MVDEKRHDREIQIEIKDQVLKKPEICLQLPNEFTNNKRQVWIDMTFDPFKGPNGEWTKASAYNVNFKWLGDLKHALIFRKQFDLLAPKSYADRARSAVNKRPKRSQSSKSRT